MLFAGTNVYFQCLQFIAGLNVVTAFHRHAKAEANIVLTVGVLLCKWASSAMAVDGGLCHVLRGVHFFWLPFAMGLPGAANGHVALAGSRLVRGGPTLRCPSCTDAHKVCL